MPVVVVTRCESVEEYLFAVSLGVYEYLNKPLRPGQLQSIIRTAIRARRAGKVIVGKA